MSSRTSRKRYRRREARLKATAIPSIVDQWGWGTLAPSIAGDLLLLRQAVNQGWIPADRRKAFIDAIAYLFDQDETPTRVTIAACQTVLAMAKQG